MLLDNKTKTEDNDYFKVFDFIKNYTQQGGLDLVTGYFSVNALALLNDDVNGAEKFRMILGNLMQDDSQVNKIIDLLNGDAGIDNTLALSTAARKAVEFLEQEKVQVKNIQKNFCHAKTYIYTDKDSIRNFHIIGSSNLTDAGLGIKESSNIELNTAATGNNNDYKELKTWFKHQWEKVAQDKIELPDKDKTKVPVKEHIIELIKNLFKEYTPHDLYFKVLYELFKEDLLSLTSDAEFKREIEHLEQTEIYKILFPYQQKGALSLIKMLQKYNGAILADAVGLGKTWTALAVMKYFENKGYTVVLFCPKKLRQNWEQYKSGSGSRFERDEIEYLVRNHTDLQDERLSSDYYSDFPLSKIQRKQKVLFVIDESHNLRNDKSSRYKFLVDNVLLPEKTSREVKVLHLSATPINNKLVDIRNQFKLMTKGDDDGFEKSELAVGSLESIFRTAQKDFNDWSEHDNKKIADFISKLPQKFFDLTDALIVARTRKLIEGESTSIGTQNINGIIYQWNPTTGLNNSTIAQPTASPQQTTNYILTITDTSGVSGCDERTDTITVFVSDAGCEIKFPSLISLDDKLQQLSFSEHYAINIFNAVGQLVYTNNDYNGNWKPNTKGFYIIKLQCTNGNIVQQKLIVQ